MLHIILVRKKKLENINNNGEINMIWKWNCDNCGGQIVASAYLFRDKVFCSKKCYNTYRDNLIIKRRRR